MIEQLIHDIAVALVHFGLGTAICLGGAWICSKLFGGPVGW